MRLRFGHTCQLLRRSSRPGGALGQFVERALAASVAGSAGRTRGDRRNGSRQRCRWRVDLQRVMKERVGVYYHERLRMPKRAAWPGGA